MLGKVVFMGEWNGPEEKRHVLTVEDRQKGGKVISERKRKALVMNPLKTGKYAKTLEGFQFCDGCIYKDSCLGYQKHQPCRLKLVVLKQMNQVAGANGAKAWLNVVLRSMQELFVLTKTTNSDVEKRIALKEYMKLWIEFGKIMFPKQIQVTNKDQEIRVIFGEDQDDSCKD